MSQPSPEQQDAALAYLAGNLTSARPETELDRAKLRCALVAQAQARGVTWAQIGAGLGMSGKAAKRHMKQVAARANRELLASQAPQPQPRREPYVHEMSDRPEDWSGKWVPYTVSKVAERRSA